MNLLKEMQPYKILHCPQAAHSPPGTPMENIHALYKALDNFNEAKNKLPPDIRYVLCQPSKRNTRSRTRGNNVRTLLSELLYNNVNKELHLQELYSSARASRNSQKCFEMFLYEAFFAQTVDLLVLALTVYLKLHFRYSFLLLYNNPQVARK